MICRAAGNPQTPRCAADVVPRLARCSALSERTIPVPGTSLLPDADMCRAAWGKATEPDPAWRWAQRRNTGFWPQCRVAFAMSGHLAGVIRRSNPWSNPCSTASPGAVWADSGRPAALCYRASCLHVAQTRDDDTQAHGQKQEQQGPARSSCSSSNLIYRMASNVSCHLASDRSPLAGPIDAPRRARQSPNGGASAPRPAARLSISGRSPPADVRLFSDHPRRPPSTWPAAGPACPAPHSGPTFC